VNSIRGAVAGLTSTAACALAKVSRHAAAEDLKDGSMAFYCRASAASVRDWPAFAVNFM
jgi:hypothetical protein